MNNILRENIDRLSANYDYTIIDCEAGLEHLSRRTTKDVDIMFVVLDQSKLSLNTALRIKELAKEVDINFKKLFLVQNKGQNKNFENEAGKLGVNVIGILTNDDGIVKLYSEGRAIIGIGSGSEAFNAVKKIWENQNLY